MLTAGQRNHGSDLSLLLQGDCLEKMRSLLTGSVHLILCDLPYGTTQNKWDSVIPLDALWAEYKRVLHPQGTAVLSSQGLFTAQLMLSNPAWFKYKLVWVKSKATNFLNAKVQPLRKHEDICVFAPGKGYYDPQMTEGAQYDKGVRKDQQTGSYGAFNPTHVKSEGSRYPTDVIYFPTAEAEGKVWHPTQKPLSLGRYLVRTYSKPGDTVLDNAFGSGSFLVSALLEGRSYVGIERNEGVTDAAGNPLDLLQVAQQRLEAATKEMESDTLTLFGGGRDLNSLPRGR